MNITSRKRQVVDRAVRKFLDEMTAEFVETCTNKEEIKGYILKANHYFSKEKIMRQDAIDLVSEYYDEYE